MAVKTWPFLNDNSEKNANQQIKKSNRNFCVFGMQNHYAVFTNVFYII